MARFKPLFWRSRSPAYERIRENSSEDQRESSNSEASLIRTFSWIEYLVFLLLGVAMLWAWNMFLAANPYFQKRFKADAWILKNFQSAISITATATNLTSVLLLTRMRSNASYPKRIGASLVLGFVVFTLLTLSTIFFLDVSPVVYLVFLLTMVFVASLATGMIQNGVFAYVSGFGREEYTQAIMTGQAVAGVLPCVAGIISVLSVPAQINAGSNSIPAPESSTSAFYYFLTASVVSVITLLAFIYLNKRSKTIEKIQESPTLDASSIASNEISSDRQHLALWHLFKKLKWLAISVFLCFGLSMLFPIFTQSIRSLNASQGGSRLFEPAVFISLGFLMWNVGDLLGRLLTLVPFLQLTQRPRLIFAFAILRFVFIPLYLMCNLHGQGAVIHSDLFYLLIVQLGFGLSNGWLGSTCMMGAGDWVEPAEREVAGSLMVLFLVGGLTVGSLLSFTASWA